MAPKGAERAHMATSEIGEMATLKPTDRARPEGGRTSSEPTGTAAKTAAGSRDEITSDPTSHMTETPAVTSASSTPRRDAAPDKATARARATIVRRAALPVCRRAIGSRLESCSVTSAILL